MTDLPATTEVYRVVYVGRDNENSNALVFKPPTAGRSFNRVLVIDDDNGSTGWFGDEDEPVPHREKEPGDADYTSDKYGHTWHYAK